MEIRFLTFIKEATELFTNWLFNGSENYAWCRIKVNTHHDEY